MRQKTNVYSTLADIAKNIYFRLLSLLNLGWPCVKVKRGEWRLKKTTNVTQIVHVAKPPCSLRHVLSSLFLQYERCWCIVVDADTSGHINNLPTTPASVNTASPFHCAATSHWRLDLHTLSTPYILFACVRGRVHIYLIRWLF